MAHRILMTMILSLLAISYGCKGTKEGSARDQEAVRAGIQRHLADAGVNLDMMKQETKKITFTGDQALADVDFRVKDGDPNLGMTVEYVLEQKNGQWDVVKTQPVGGGQSPQTDQSTPQDK